MAFEPKVAGKWHAARSGRDIAAELFLTDDGDVAVRDAQTGAILVRSARSDLLISRRVGSVPRRIGFSDDSVFVCRDNDGVDRLLADVVGRGSRWLVEIERFRPRLIVLVAAVVLLAVGVYRFAVPLLVEVAVLATPEIVPELMSKGALASLDETAFSESTLPEQRRARIATDFLELAALTPRGASRFDLQFRSGGSIGPNAFALPNGTIVVTDELVDLAGSDDELVLGVLGHEIGHVEHDHSLRQLYRAAGVVGLIMVIGGDVGSGVQDLLVQGSALLALSYSRRQERDADRYSVEIMARAGRDPAAIARFFELMRARFGDAGNGAILTTHPATGERIEETRRYAAEIARSGGVDPSN
ncbi:M48 family metallopeptidase [Nitratireductor alexandrii]|uniref:M48 family metallopeptidase n=1 Tax=Nitratireductor alexandrii TaxID=2448161 RepID=UPI001EE942BA|nr:M48 family metallopeptidase [Nitratireductor alexandrii]